jgi:hypothetical protein
MSEPRRERCFILRDGTVLVTDEPWERTPTELWIQMGDGVEHHFRYELTQVERDHHGRRLEMALYVEADPLEGGPERG